MNDLNVIFHDFEQELAIQNITDLPTYRKQSARNDQS